MNSIGPLWDGNEVWLVTFGGALFAMFPNGYASLFSAFYLPFVLLLFALIFRAVSLEFRSKRTSAFWRNFWDTVFFIGSTLAAFLFGVAVGRIMQGLVVSELGDYQGTFGDLLTGFSISVGLLNIALLAMHGSIYLYLKTEGELQKRLVAWMKGTYFCYLALFVIVTAWSLFYVPTSIRNFAEYPFLWLAIINIPRAIKREEPLYAFFSSCATIAALVFLFAAAIFPDLLPAANNPQYSVTIFNGASSVLTLKIGLIIVAIGMPMVTSYTILIYWTFRGKVTLDEQSY